MRLSSADGAYGYVGSSGNVRAREPTRNEYPDHLKNKVERADGMRHRA
jgi:hypothetical protein